MPEEHDQGLDTRQVFPESDSKSAVPHNLIRFLGRLVRDVGRKVFLILLILDRLPVHRSAKVRAWLDERQAETEACSLPPYSPEP